ncbi:hypothetical protein niasHT_038066 [Heterodera trifolii]|uniref:Metalloprotease TIKI homolog n=1 Tax=Heterodera trifolii TaxID=157864 RepID=A0ABD2HPJ1_9BILA
MKRVREKEEENRGRRGEKEVAKLDNALEEAETLRTECAANLEGKGADGHTLCFIFHFRLFCHQFVVPLTVGRYSLFFITVLSTSVLPFPCLAYPSLFFSTVSLPFPPISSVFSLISFHYSLFRCHFAKISSKFAHFNKTYAKESAQVKRRAVALFVCRFLSSQSAKMKMPLLRPVYFCLRFFAFSFSFSVFFAQNEKAQKAKSTFLWSIDSPSRNVRSFLFGTIHVPYDKVWQYVSPRVKEAFGAAEVIVFELELQNSEIVQQLAKCKQMERDANIKQWLSTQLYSRLKAFMHRLKQRMFRWHFQKNGNNRQKARQNVRRMFPSDWERRKPMWLLFLLLQAGDDQQWAMEDSERRVPMFDLYLAQLAHGQGKRILSVESVEEQCHPLESVKTDQLLFAINYTLAYLEWAEKRWDGKSHGEEEEKPKGDRSALAQLVELYKCGAMGEGMEERGFSSSPEADQLARHVDTLLAEDILLRRNERMARRADRLLRSHPSAVLFFAIGAGHLLGDRSILAHLRQLGYWMAPVGENDRIINAGPWESEAMAPDEIGQFWDLTKKQRKKEGSRRRIALQIGELWPEDGKRNGAKGGRGTQRQREDTKIWGPRQMHQLFPALLLFPLSFASLFLSLPFLY